MLKVAIREAIKNTNIRIVVARLRPQERHFRSRSFIPTLKI